MRSEVIDKILLVEEEAQSIRAKADAEAHQIILDAQSAAARLVKEAQEEERRRGDEAIEAQSATIDERIQAMEKEGGSLSTRAGTVDSERIRSAVERIAAELCSVPLFEA